MRLVDFAVGDFQSYHELQELTLDPQLTLIAGRNNTGKSALLRALRIFTEPQEGCRDSFQVTFSWSVEADELRPHLPDANIGSAREHTLSATYALVNAAGPDGRTAADQLYTKEIVLRELDWRLKGTAGQQSAWETGPLSGSATNSESLVNWALTLNRNIAYIGPRLIQQGKRQYNPQRTLTPDAQNLTDVVAHLQLATPTTTFDKLLREPRLFEFTRPRR